MGSNSEVRGRSVSGLHQYLSQLLQPHNVELPDADRSQPCHPRRSASSNFAVARALTMRYICRAHVETAEQTRIFRVVSRNKLPLWPAKPFASIRVDGEHAHVLKTDDGSPRRARPRVYTQTRPSRCGLMSRCSGIGYCCLLFHVQRAAFVAPVPLVVHLLVLPTARNGAKLPPGSILETAPSRRAGRSGAAIA